MKYGQTTISETNIATLVESFREGIPYEEKFACGWLSDMDKPSARLITIATKFPDATIVVFGDETIGIQIGGNLWAAEDASGERGTTRTFPHGDWRWLNWASAHGIHDGYQIISFGDKHDLRKVWPG